MATTVVVIGGPPGGGKTTTGRALGARLGWTSLTIDDLARAVRAMVPEETLPDLHAIGRVPSVEYFTTTTPADLMADAERQHRALWPAVAAVIRHHLAFGPPIVIDGYHLLPERIPEVATPDLLAVFLDVEPDVLEERERSLSYYDGSDDPEAMIANFLGRSNGWNRRIADAARSHGHVVLRQDGSKSADDLVDAIVALMR